MYLQDTSIAEYFIAHIAVIWTLPSIYSLMSLQATSIADCFIVHITAIWKLPSMYTLKYFRLPVLLNIVLHTSQIYERSAVCTFVLLLSPSAVRL